MKRITSLLSDRYRMCLAHLSAERPSRSATGLYPTYAGGVYLTHHNT